MSLAKHLFLKSQHLIVFFKNFCYHNSYSARVNKHTSLTAEEKKQRRPEKPEGEITIC